MKKQFLRIEEIHFTLDEDESKLLYKISKILGIHISKIYSFEIVKKAIDSRNKSNILFVYSVNVDVGKNENFIQSFQANFSVLFKKHKMKLIEPFIYEINTIHSSKINKSPIIVGTGPSGLFCGLALSMAGLGPIILERGSEVSKRVSDVQTFFLTGKLNIHSNVQFGEGGAGTFSDGKLYTLVNDHRSKFIFEQFVQAGAPKEILYSARPHIGTDKLREVVKNLRKKIISLGGEFYFDTMMTDIEIQNNKIQAVLTSNDQRFETNELIFGIGHSARETYEMLYQHGFEIQQKPFSIGVRIEHPRTMIDSSQYGQCFRHEKIGTAHYKLVSHHEKQRSVYTFCMCPGGQVIPASSEEGKLTINGMSEYAQKNINSNSALLVNVFPSDFGSTHPLAGIEFQRKWEEKAFVCGGRNYSAPAQLVGDFLANIPSTKLRSIQTTYQPNLTLTNLSSCLPDFVVEALKEALPNFDKKIRGFAHKDAILIALESRSSSPVRFVRNEFCESNIKGAYPMGEGAGYAGGITSSAIDGLLVAENVIKKYREE